MVLVEGTGEVYSAAGSTPHLGPDRPVILVTVLVGRDALTARLKPSHALLLSKSLAEDAHALEPFSTQWEDANQPGALDEDE